MNIFILQTVRWIYYGQHSGSYDEFIHSHIFRINFDGTDKRVIVKNLTSYVYGIGIGM